MSGDAISLAAEKDDAGKYSAEYVEVKNCAFYKVLGYAVDLYRGGSDESTTGPTIVVDHCVLEDVNNKERGLWHAAVWCAKCNSKEQHFFKHWSRRRIHSF